MLRSITLLCKLIEDLWINLKCTIIVDYVILLILLPVCRARMYTPLAMVILLLIIIYHWLIHDSEDTKNIIYNRWLCVVIGGGYPYFKIIYIMFARICSSRR